MKALALLSAVARAARAATLAARLSAALLLASLPLSASAQAIAIQLPLLGGSAAETSKPIEVSLPSIKVTLPGVSVTTPEVGVSVQAPAPAPPVTTPAPSTPSQPIEVPTPSAPVAAAPVLGGAGSSSAGSPTATTASTTAPSPSSSTSAHPAVTTTQRPNSVRRSAARSRSKRSRSLAVSSPTAPSRPAAVALAANRSSASPARRTSVAKHSSNSPLASLGSEIPLPIPVPDWSKPIILALLALAGFFALRSRLAARRAGRLEGQRESLLHDLGVVQAALVPEVPASLGGLGVSVAYRPADGPAAGGDFYDVFLAEPGKVVMILGDVSGHGHEAVSHAALTRYTLRAYMQAGLEPRAALALAGRVMADPACEHFATVAVGVYRQQEGTLTYASAGHPGPIIVGTGARASSEACCSPPIGWSAPSGRRQSIVSLPRDAVVCFFTDGLIEARGREDLLLGREHLEELFSALGPRPEASELLERVRAEAIATPDDLAACILRAQESGVASEIHIEELEVDLRRLSGDGVSRFMADCQVPAQAAGQVLARAKTIAEERGSALIRVKMGEHAASATVTAATASQVPPGLAEELVRAQSPGQPLSIA